MYLFLGERFGIKIVTGGYMYSIKETVGIWVSN